MITNQDVLKLQKVFVTKGDLLELKTHLETKFDHVHIELGHVKTEIGDVKMEVGHLKEGLDDVRVEVGHLKEGLHDVRLEVGHLKEGLDDVRVEVGHLKENLGDLRIEVGELDVKFDRLDTRVYNFGGNLHDLEMENKAGAVTTSRHTRQIETLAQHTGVVLPD